jgi:UDP-N-acetylglucosamine acyltransferase
VIEGLTTHRAGQPIFQFAASARAQDKKYAGEPTELLIGDGNTIREFCTINTGTVQDAGGVTRMGDDNWIMAYVHIAHDCQAGHDHTTWPTTRQMAGHVHLGDWVFDGRFDGRAPVRARSARTP